MSQDKPVVFVVDDDASVRDSLNSLISSAGWCPEIFGSGQAFFAHPRPNAPNCLILDVNLPDISGLDLQKLVTVERTDTPIIFVTGFGDVGMAVRAMKAGAFEFLMKPIHADALLTAIKEALERSRTALEFELEVSALQNRYASLSCREREVMALVVSGLLNKQVGFELGISEITVKAHRGQVMRKMNARSLPHLVNMAAVLGLMY
ncbi:response regulator transcription factor [Mesorhizobium sp. M1C.F.Ca.ET.193.01.1.1]|nr:MULTISPECIES: response regulator [unclassified Mesorhizobium]TGS92210.1 response regulator transcription factor [bacterium M00.F.Ca.ET.177.01.1.1]TGQ50097.1 response regulator transcription factor [Mesorhizobium sp. M1C.F.Ca.ET.210.01.1.1]TGQ64789.1 response regulator transcription factor [Mesorhizobium sp. M1C.F.Ca.ET.212.01.1.1]TGQ98571.1 response regulator transcription factor [Mesorhizobium sp. M1C.F.Ca.ET.204.01.1.1]TGR18708.1 response regulator transcription factor [Mesorhizobium sp. 